MVITEGVWDLCVYISCTGGEGQLGSSFLWNGRGRFGLDLRPVRVFVVDNTVMETCFSSRSSGIP